MNCALSEVSLVGSPLDLISLKDKRIQVPYKYESLDSSFHMTLFEERVASHVFGEFASPVSPSRVLFSTGGRIVRPRTRLVDSD